MQFSFFATMGCRKEKSLDSPINTVIVDGGNRTSSAIVLCQQGAFPDSRTQWLVVAAIAAGGDCIQKVRPASCTEVDPSIDFSTTILPMDGLNLWWSLLSQANIPSIYDQLKESLPATELIAWLEPKSFLGHILTKVVPSSSLVAGGLWDFYRSVLI